MFRLTHFMMVGLLAQTQPGAPQEPKRAQDLQEQRQELSFKLSADGHVELVVREKDTSTGKLIENIYHADSIEAFKKKYPEVAQKYSIDRFAMSGPPAGPGHGDFAKDFEEWKKRFDEKWFWDHDREGGLEKWLENLPKAPHSEELEKWLAEQRQLFEKFRGIEPPASPEPGKAESHSGRRLGVLIAPVGDTLASQLGFDKPQGVVVAAVQKGSLAEKSGLRSNDVIIKITGKAVTDVGFFRKEVLSSSGPFDLEIIRQGKQQTLKVTPEKHEEKSSD